MKVNELIEILNKCNPELVVTLWKNNSERQILLEYIHISKDIKGKEFEVILGNEALTKFGHCYKLLNEE